MDWYIYTWCISYTRIRVCTPVSPPAVIGHHLLCWSTHIVLYLVTHGHHWYIHLVWMRRVWFIHFKPIGVTWRRVATLMHLYQCHIHGHHTNEPMVTGVSWLVHHVIYNRMFAPPNVHTGSCVIISYTTPHRLLTVWHHAWSSIGIWLKTMSRVNSSPIYLYCIVAPLLYESCTIHT